MKDIKKLSFNDLIEMTNGVNVNIEDHSKIGSMHIKSNGVYAQLQLPIRIDPGKNVSMLIKFDSFDDKAAFTFGYEELKQQSNKLTVPDKTDQNYILFENDRVYQVSIKEGVVLYLTEEEVAGLYVVFSKVKELLEEVIKSPWFQKNIYLTDLV